MASPISLGEIAQLTKKAVEIINGLASAPKTLRTARIKIAAVETYLRAIQREARKPAAKINANKDIRRDAERLLGFCMAQMEEVHLISIKYEGEGDKMSAMARIKWVGGDHSAWIEALNALDEVRVVLSDYIRDVIGVIGTNAVEAALDDTDDEEKAVNAAIAKKTKKNNRPVSQEERDDLLTFAHTITSCRGPRKPKSNANGNDKNKDKPNDKTQAAKPKPKSPPTSRLECWVVRTVSSPTGITKTWKQEKRAQEHLRQTAKDLRASTSPQKVTSVADERVQWLLKRQSGGEPDGSKARWVFVAGRVVQRGLVGFASASETAMLVVRREVPQPPKPKKEKKDEKGLQKGEKKGNGKDGKGAEKKKHDKGAEKKKDEKAPEKKKDEKAPEKKKDDKAPEKKKDDNDKDKLKPVKDTGGDKKAGGKPPLGDCRYGADCFTVDCKYKHPQRGPCRWGEQCSKDKCGFEHGARQCRYKVCRKAGCAFKHRAGQRGKVDPSLAG